MRKTAIIDTELTRRKVDLAALQETRLAGLGTIKESNYSFFWFGKSPDEPRIYGTGFAVSNSLLRSTQSPVAISDRISTMKINTKQGVIHIVNAYAPTLGATSDDKDDFYNQLEDTIRDSTESERVIVLGDLNARIGSDNSSWPECIGHFGVGKMNENGQRLLQLRCRNNLVVTNTLFPGKPHRKVSWCHPRSKTWHQLDFVIASLKYRNEVLNTRTYHSADCDTDHSLVVSTLRLEPRPYHRQTRTSKKIDLTSWQNPEFQKQYCQLLDQKLVNISDDDTHEKHWEKLRTSIHSAALESFGQRKRQDPDWYSNSCSTLKPILEMKRAAMLKVKARPTRQAHAAHRAAKAEAQRSVRNCVRNYWDSLCTSIETARDTGNIKEMFAGIKTATGPTVQGCGVLKRKDGSIIDDKAQKLERWIEHYSELYGPVGTADHQYIEQLPNLPERDVLDTPPDLAEVASMVNNLRSGRAAGMDEIPAELLKSGSDSLCSQIHILINKCWTARSVPQSFKDAKISTLYKNKGDRGDCNNYRGISLLSVTGKLLARILLRRLQKIAEEVYPESQCGFRSNRSTTDMIFAVRQLQEKSREQREPLYLAFVDLTKAFDLVDRQSLFTVLKKVGCPPTLLALVESFHHGMQARVQYDGELSGEFSIKRGVKQGCVLAPTLFGIYFSFVFLTAYQNLCTPCGVSLLTRSDGDFFNLQRFKAKSRTKKFIIRELLYADDAAICASTSEDLQTLLNHFAEACRRFGLTISLKKTVTMSQATDSPIFSIDDTTLQEVDKFTYLGSSLSKSATVDSEISTRLGIASTNFGKLTKRVWNNRHLSTKSKVRVYEACVLSILLYGVETLATYRPQESKLSAFHTRNLRFILGKTWEDKMTNEELFSATGSGPLSSRLKYIRLRWAGHVNRMPSHRIPHMLLHSVLAQGTRHIGRPRLRFKDVLKRDLRDFDIRPESWTTLSQDRVTWRSNLLRGSAFDTEKMLDTLRRRRMNRSAQ